MYKCVGRYVREKVNCFKDPFMLYRRIFIFRNGVSEIPSCIPFPYNFSVYKFLTEIFIPSNENFISDMNKLNIQLLDLLKFNFNGDIREFQEIH